MCALGGECPARVDIDDPANVADDGSCHYLDRRVEALPDAATWQTQELPPLAYVLMT